MARCGWLTTELYGSLMSNDLSKLQTLKLEPAYSLKSCIWWCKTMLTPRPRKCFQHTPGHVKTTASRRKSWCHLKVFSSCVHTQLLERQLPEQQSGSLRRMHIYLGIWWAMNGSCIFVQFLQSISLRSRFISHQHEHCEVYRMLCQTQLHLHRFILLLQANVYLWI